MPRLYALLVGINDYSRSSASDLGGCLQDIEFYEAFLKDHYPEDLRLEVLRDAEAERENIIDHFRKHLGNAGKDDVALFVYAGHGARWKSAPEFSAFYPDGYDEGLVCHDSRSESASFPYDLADKELAMLINDLAANDPHIAVILDSCHSGSATRGAAEMEGAKIRATLSVDEARPLESYLDGRYSKMLKEGSALTLPASRHILMAACRRTQCAFELKGRGAFSTNVDRVLDTFGPEISYAELFSRCRAAMRVPKNQDPQFETYGQFNGYTTFLGSTVKARSRHLVFFDKAEKGWIVECGALQSLPADADKPVELELFAEDGTSIGVARTTQVGMQRSRIDMPKGHEEPGEEQFDAEVISLPVPPMPVFLSGDEEGAAAARAALTESVGASFVDSAEGVDYAVEASEETLLLKHAVSGVVIQGVRGYGEASAACLAGWLKQIVQWERTLDLQNDGTHMNTADLTFSVVQTLDDGREDLFEVALEGGRDRVYAVDGKSRRPITEPEIVLKYTGSADHMEDDLKVRFRVSNGSAQPLHCTLVSLTESFSVSPRANEEFPPGTQDADLYDTNLMLEDDWDEETLWFKLLVSTERIDDQFLKLKPDFEWAKTGKLRGKIVDVAGASRGERAERPLDKIRHENEWFAKTVRLKIVRQVDAVSGEDVEIADGAVSVSGHPRFRAGISLTAVPNATRGATSGSDALTVLTARGLDVVDPVPSRGDAGPPRALELTEIEGDDALASEPLEISVHLPLDDDEHLLPVTFDGDHFLMVGDPETNDDGSTVVRIDHIPDTRSNSRSLAKSLKLFFLKTRLNRNDVNTLGWVRFGENGPPELVHRDVAAQVAGADNVLLLVHGILGGCDALARAVSDVVAANGARLCDQFDLVIYYEYESLNTPMQETARKLKSDLEVAGLSSGDGKTLTILSHATGGLVARWLVEQEGGASVVDHLVMCGTPNFGSPLGMIGTARKVLTGLSSLALNLPGAIAVVPTALLILNRSKEFTPTLEQLDSSSELISTLRTSEDPGVRYTILAGDISRVEQAGDRASSSLLDKIGRSVVFKALFGPRHDIAASVDSIAGIQEGRAPEPAIREVACHHLDYFSSDAARRELAGIDW